MDSYDSHHPPGRGRSPESSTPIYDRLLAEWRDAVRRDEAPWAQGATSDPAASGSPAPGREGAFVPAARTAGDGR
ncbi:MULTISPECIES: hypothetical protein [unclassified Streptomyces]|uniref:hypothetical protein n=1 Tax=unclassified Streptomyces TaxID=2593676 RepID=UPI000CD4EF4A|nr:hypothetical protein [Streptomyces sp. SM10]